jgi:hypothetical protein
MHAEIDALLDTIYANAAIDPFDAALSALEQLLDAEADFARASRLQAIIIELAILRHTRKHSR